MSASELDRLNPLLWPRSSTVPGSLKRSRESLLPQRSISWPSPSPLFLQPFNEGQKKRRRLSEEAKQQFEDQTGESTQDLCNASFVQQQYLDWELSSPLIAPLSRSRVRRAVERCFLNWIMYPCDLEKGCGGYLPLTPALYDSEHSSPLLRSAVEALAFANVGDAKDIDGRWFHTKARARYGAVIQELRGIVATSHPNALLRGDVLASILLLDNWELVYGSRQGIRDSHIDIVLYILTLRLDSGACEGVNPSILRVANDRVLCRLLLADEEDNLKRLRACSNLFANDTYSHMVADAFQIADFRDEMRKYTTPRMQQDDVSPSQKLEVNDFRGFVQRIHHYLETARNRTRQAPELWSPRKITLSTLYDTDAGRILVQQRLDLPTSSVWRFHGLWIASMRTSH